MSLTQGHSKVIQKFDPLAKKLEQGDAALSCFSCYVANNGPFPGLFSVRLFSFSCFLLVISLFKMVPSKKAKCWLQFLSTEDCEVPCKGKTCVR